MSIEDQLLESPEPAIQWKTRVHVLGENPIKLRALQKKIKTSETVQRLLCQLGKSGVVYPPHVYAKWQGAHWIMAVLADIGYPTGDKSLKPVRDQLQETWLQQNFYTDFEATSKAEAYKQQGVPVMQGRHRRCASQQSNALWAILKLDLVNDDTHKLVERLLYWQWPDGGWNCDKNPAAIHSSFMESILPMRALALYGKEFSNDKATAASKRASEIFLKREMYLGQRSGCVMRSEFTSLHYPLYWHYDILHGLKVIAESCLIHDKRCTRALDLLEGKQLPDGGWPAEKKYYKCTDEVALGNDYVDWGGTSKKKMNPWITVDALYVLKQAGRIT